MRNLLAVTCALAVFATVALAACGGDGGASEDDFVAEVDAICADTAHRVSDLYAAEGAPDSNAELESFSKKRVPISERAQEQAKAIEPPEELAGEYDTYLAARQKIVDLVLEQGKAAAAGDGRRAIEIDGELSAANEAAIAPAGELGLVTCAGRLPAEQEEEVATVLERVQLTSDPAQCSEDYTDNIVEGAGGLSACEQAERRGDPGQPDSIEITSIEGTDHLTASAKTTASGGKFDGRVTEISLVYEDGRWKVDEFALTRE